MRQDNDDEMQEMDVDADSDGEGQENAAGNIMPTEEQANFHMAPRATKCAVYHVKHKKPNGCACMSNLR